ncbi:uncharacterized protein LOC111028413 [Myzus persicae]|uniref:uncharacterized protein LOC111028413 n=1 Tax=Myzus persicae TaxID=13164 RepID=UPI000B930947|nr:uncharacterized protein LOC111028413 [Myzus persicae]
MFTQKTEKIIDRQIRQITFLSQYINHVEHLQGDKNIVPDALSRFEVSAMQVVLPDLKQWSTDLANDPELKDILTGTTETALKIEPRSTAEGTIYPDTSTKQTRMYEPLQHRRTVFDGLRGQAHGGGSATSRLIKARYCWPCMDKQIKYWTKCCIQCQRTKVFKHIVSPITPFAPFRTHTRRSNWSTAPIQRLQRHSRRSGYLVLGSPTWSQLTKDANSNPDHPHSEPRHPTPQNLPYHPQANGLVERFHRKLKTAIQAQDTENWSLRLPIVLLPLRNTIKPDIGHSPAEMVYGMSLRLPGEMFHPAPPDAKTMILEPFIYLVTM